MVEIEKEKHLENSCTDFLFIDNYMQIVMLYFTNIGFWATIIPIIWPLELVISAVNGHL